MYAYAGNDPVNFGYDPRTRLVHSTTVPGRGTEWYGYRWETGNLDLVKSPRGVETRFLHDGAGQVTETNSPIDSVWSTPTPSPWNPNPSPGMRERRLLQRSAYYVNGLVRLEETKPESFDGTAVQTASVAYTYDEEGNRRTASRSSSPDAANVGTLTTTWLYDALGQVIREYEPGGARITATDHDPWRGTTVVTTRRDLKVTTETDALGRMTARTTQGVTYPTWTEGVPSIPLLARDNAGQSADSTYAKPYGGYAIAQQRAEFRYDPSTGALASAVNPDAVVNRTYYPNGQIKTETQRVRTLVGNDTTTHTYTLTYDYDLGGRRKSVQHPPELAPAGGTGLTLYGYDLASGLLTNVTDPMGMTFTYGYDAAGDQVTLRYPGGEVERRGFDADGNLLSHDVAGGPTEYRRARMRYDLRGKALSYMNTKGVADTLSFAYAPLGHLTWSDVIWHGVAVFPGQNIPARTSTRQMFRLDALANVVHDSTESTTWINGRPASTSRSRSAWRYQLGTGRLGRGDQIGAGMIQTDTSRYDADGNVQFNWQIPGDRFYQYLPVARDRASYYAADGKLRAADFRTAHEPGSLQARLTRTFEEFRYDALGRRVLVYTRRWCNENWGGYWPECNTPVVRRTVWDGDAELHEIRVPEAVAESEGAVPQYVPVSGSQFQDMNKYFGRVLYTHGLATDQPLSVTRSEYADASVPSGSGFYSPAPYLWYNPVSVVPLWNSRGQADLAVFPRDACRNRAQNRCMSIQLQQGWQAYNRWGGDLNPAWHGSLLEDKRDHSQTLYRRNRNYDPATGRFTQEDPIGLAGGLNLYGYANGDPANYSDPFGLCPPKDLSEVLKCTGQLLQPAQGPLEAMGTLAVAPLAGGMGMAGGGITTLGLAGRAALGGTALARALGAAGEAASGLVKNTQRIPSATGTAAFRIPDGLTATTLSEVKNVAKLSLTNQLRDFAAFAQQTGRTFELHVRSSTELSGPLQQFIKDNSVLLRILK